MQTAITHNTFENRTSGRISRRGSNAAYTARLTAIETPCLAPLEPRMNRDER